MSNLTEIANKYGTDKGIPGHGYTEIYPKYLPKDPKKILEIGVFHGASLRMWNEYYPNLEKIYGIDFFCKEFSPSLDELNKIQSENSKFEILYTDQSNRDQLTEVAKKIGDFTLDFILDDGSHNTDEQQISLAMLFRTVKSGGVYIIEDLTDKIYPLGGWNIKDMVNYSDATVNILDNFNQTKKFVTPYLTDSETDYLEKNIDRVILDLRIGHNLAFIFKK